MALAAPQQPDDAIRITDEEKELFAKIAKAAYHMGLTAEQLAVYNALKYHASGRLVEPSTDSSLTQLATLVNVSRDTVIRAIKVLENDKGMIRVERRKEGKKNLPNNYILLSMFKWAPEALLEEMSYTDGGSRSQQPLNNRVVAHSDQGSRSQQPPKDYKQDLEPEAADAKVVPQNNGRATVDDHATAAATALDEQGFNPTTIELLTAFQRDHQIRPKQWLAIVHALIVAGCNEDSFLHALTETESREEDQGNPLRYFKAVALANRRGSLPAPERDPKYTNGRRDLDHHDKQPLQRVMPSKVDQKAWLRSVHGDRYE